MTAHLSSPDPTGTAPAVAGAASHVRILVAEDHPILREALIHHLSREPDFEVVGFAVNGDQALALYTELAPDLVLADYAMPLTNGIELLRALKGVDPEVCILLFSAYDDAALVTAAMGEGAVGFLHKSSSMQVVSDGIRTALQGGPVLDKITGTRVVEGLRAALAAPAAQPPPAAVPGRLSRRECEVVKAISAGHTNAEVGELLHISPRTVKTHVSRIMTKLGARDRAAAVHIATRDGLI